MQHLKKKIVCIWQIANFKVYKQYSLQERHGVVLTIFSCDKKF